MTWHGLQKTNKTKNSWLCPISDLTSFIQKSEPELISLTSVLPILDKKRPAFKFGCDEWPAFILKPNTQFLQQANFGVNFSKSLTWVLASLFTISKNNIICLSCLIVKQNYQQWCCQSGRHCEVRTDSICLNKDNKLGNSSVWSWMILQFPDMIGFIFPKWS